MHSQTVLHYLNGDTAPRRAESGEKARSEAKGSKRGEARSVLTMFHDYCVSFRERRSLSAPRVTRGSALQVDHGANVTLRGWPHPDVARASEARAAAFRRRLRS